MNDTAENNFSPLAAAAAGGHLDLCELLLEHKADVNEVPGDNYNPQIGAALDAIQHGDLEAFKTALASIDPRDVIWADGEAAIEGRRQRGLPRWLRPERGLGCHQMGHGHAMSA